MKTCCIFFIISRSVLRMRNFSNESFRGLHNTHFMFNKLFRKSCLNEIMLKNFVENDRPQTRIWRPHIAFCIPKATETHSECVILIDFLL
jgi:hypothetical protein